ncbi:hypothetical protein D3C76_1209470 [compost metagenome]
MFKVSASKRTLTNWLGNSVSSLFSKRALNFRVPVVVSIWLSILRSTPVACCFTSLRSQASTGRAAPVRKRLSTSGRLPWGKVKLTVIGWIWVMTTRAVVSLAATRLPTSSWRRPRRPVIGARILVNSRFSLASPTAAWLVLIVPSYWRTRAAWVSRVCLAILSSANRPR